MVGTGWEIFAFWSSITQENVFPGAFLRFAIAYLKMLQICQTFHFSAEKWGAHGPPVAWALILQDFLPAAQRLDRVLLEDWSILLCQFHGVWGHFRGGYLAFLSFDRP